MSFIPTNKTIEVENYPYGFTLRTTLFDTIEFDPKKGYRHITQTINPKNGRLNAPKKSTYSDLVLRYFDENNHIKAIHYSFNGGNELNKVCKVLAANFDLFTKEEISYFYNLIFVMAFVDMKAKAMYCGSKLEDLKPLYQNYIDTVKIGINTGVNVFESLQLDLDAIDKTKVENYQPFKVSISQ